MPRKKSKDSNRTFGNLNLEPDQEKRLVKFLERKGISLASFQRSLVKGWLRTGNIGEVDLNQD